MREEERKLCWMHDDEEGKNKKENLCHKLAENIDTNQRRNCEVEMEILRFFCLCGFGELFLQHHPWVFFRISFSQSLTMKGVNYSAGSFGWETFLCKTNPCSVPLSHWALFLRSIGMLGIIYLS